MAGSFDMVCVAAFTWNGWQVSVEYAITRDFFIQVSEYLLDDHWVFNAGDDFDSAATGPARFHVNSRLFLPLP